MIPHSEVVLPLVVGVLRYDSPGQTDVFASAENSLVRYTPYVIDSNTNPSLSFIYTSHISIQTSSIARISSLPNLGGFCPAVAFFFFSRRTAA